MLVKHNVATPKPLRELLTVQQVYERIMAIDTTRWGRYTLQSSNLNDYIQPNLRYDAIKSEAVLNEALEAILPTSKVIQKDQKIIGAGDMIDEEHYQTLLSTSRN